MQDFQAADKMLLTVWANLSFPRYNFFAELGSELLPVWRVGSWGLWMEGKRSEGVSLWWRTKNRLIVCLEFHSDRLINQLPSRHNTLKKLARHRLGAEWEHGGDNRGEERLKAQLRAQWVTEIFKLKYLPLPLFSVRDERKKYFYCFIE